MCFGNPGFTSVDGENESVEMMFSTKSKYLDDGKATGFFKDYAGGRYAFVALFPMKGPHNLDRRLPSGPSA